MCKRLSFIVIQQNTRVTRWIILPLLGCLQRWVREFRVKCPRSHWDMRLHSPMDSSEQINQHIRTAILVNWLVFETSFPNQAKGIILRGWQWRGGGSTSQWQHCSSKSHEVVKPWSRKAMKSYSHEDIKASFPNQAKEIYFVLLSYVSMYDTYVWINCL